MTEAETEVEVEKITHPLQLRIIEKLQEEGPMPRRDLVSKLDVPRTTVYDNLEKLYKRQVVEKYNQKKGPKPGRPLVYWKVNGGY